MKKLIATILCFLPLLGLVAGVNAVVDPANLLRAERTVDDVIAAFDSGLNADGVTDFADRRLMARYVPTFARAPQTVVLGSSRGTQIGTDMVGGELFNSCVSGATIEDLVSIYELYAENGLTPERYLISVDVWFFDRNKKDERWQLYLAQYYDAFVQAHIDAGYDGDSALTGRVLEELFSAGYFQDSVKAVRAGSYADAKLGIEATANDYTARGMLCSDGSYIYPRAYTDADVDAVRARAAAAQEASVGALRTCGGMSPEKTALFEAMVDAMRADGAQVVLLLSPYHPWLYDRIMETEEAAASLNEITAYLEEFCAQRGIDCIGSYDPNALGYPEGAFLDGLHLNRHYTQKLVEDYFFEKN